MRCVNLIELIKQERIRRFEELKRIYKMYYPY